MPSRSLSILSCLLCLAACAAGPGRVTPVAAAPNVPAAAPRAFADAEQEIDYHVFMGELADDRDDVATAVQEYLHAARLSSDAGLSSHAALLAYGAGDDKDALEAAQRWQSLAPKDRDAGHLVAVLQARAGAADAAAAILEAEVKAGLDHGYSPAEQLLEQETDAAHALPVLQRIVADNPRSAEAHLALAQLAIDSKHADLAASEARTAFDLDPHADDARVLLSRALVAQGHADQAVALMQARLRGVGDDVHLELAYAALLAQADRDAEARKEFETILKTHPDNADALYTLGLMAIQQKDMPAAHGYFARLLKTGRRSDDAYYFLGNIAEMGKRYPEALDWYHQVQDGERWLSAQAGIGRSLVASDNAQTAQEFFNDLVADDTSETVTLRLTEGQAFSDAGQPKLALKVYDAALVDKPGDDDLLYARALLLEQDGQADAAERDLGDILRRTPEDAQALNALGYTLTLHSTRYREARDYIQKALQLAPDDPAIMDSMGWVEHRLGDEDNALDYLKKAYAAQQDPEIAAHLIEVYLAKGDVQEAKAVLQKALQDDPDDAGLHALEARVAP